MERRVILAIVLMLLVALAPSLLWPPKPGTRRPGSPAPADSSVARESVTAPTPAPAPPAVPLPAREAAEPAETVWVSSELYRFGFRTRGGVLVAAQLLQYQSFAPGDSGQPVQLVPSGHPFLEHHLVVPGGDTVSLTDWAFSPSAPAVTVRGPTTLRLDATRGGSVVVLEYRFRPDDYRFDVTGSVTGMPGAGAMLVHGLGDGLRSVEVDTLEDFRHFGVVTKAAKTERLDFSKLDPGERAVLDGPFEWVGVKSKYFFVAALALEEGQPQFGGAVVTGGARTGKAATRATVALTMPVPPSGDFRYQVYAGPLEHRRLGVVGHDFDDANPYGWSIFRPIIQPMSVFVLNVLVWMHERLNLAYGWVLIVFGVMVRLLLWPLNQKAMEAGIRMQAVAPLIKEIQDRHKNEPERLQREMLRIYKEHKVNPFGGCLPMLLPMPFLLALFFVFANTIEFRGVPFLWISDLSRADPLYIIPILMGLSMYALSKVGQMGMPPNPQAKMMLYFLPIMMTVLFLNFASGLNLYYAAQNLFSIPQQYLIAKRRLREAPVPRSPTPLSR